MSEIPVVAFVVVLSIIWIVMVFVSAFVIVPSTKDDSDPVESSHEESSESSIIVPQTPVPTLPLHNSVYFVIPENNQDSNAKLSSNCGYLHINDEDVEPLCYWRFELVESISQTEAKYKIVNNTQGYPIYCVDAGNTFLVSQPTTGESNEIWDVKVSTAEVSFMYPQRPLYTFVSGSKKLAFLNNGSDSVSWVPSTTGDTIPTLFSIIPASY